MRLFERKQVRSKVGFAVFESQLPSNVLAMELDSPRGNAQGLGDILAGVSAFDEVGGTWNSSGAIHVQGLFGSTQWPGERRFHLLNRDACFAASTQTMVLNRS